jgi:hypothetical protein
MRGRPRKSKTLKPKTEIGSCEQVRLNVYPISVQISPFRDSSGFRGRSDYHVDYEVKFRGFVVEWVTTGKSCETEWILDGFFKHMQPFLLDRCTPTDKKEIHAEKAKLRMVKAEENVRLRRWMCLP